MSARDAGPASAAVLACLLLFLSAPALAATRYVGSCGMPSSASIVAAVAAASAGDSILICPGTYNEAVTVNKDNLTLRGSSGNRADVTVSNSGIPFTLSGAGATLKDMTISSSNNVGISRGWTTSGSAYVFENLAVSAKERGVYIETSAKVTMKNLSVSSSHNDAIYLNSGANGAHEFDTLTLNAKNYGLYSGKGGALFKDITVSSSNNTALHLYPSYDASFSNITATANNGGGLYLGWVSSGKALSFSNIDVTARDKGIYVEVAGKITMSDLTVRSDNDDAVYIGWAANAAHEFERLNLTSDNGNALYVNRGGVLFRDLSLTAKEFAFFGAPSSPAAFSNITATSSNNSGLYLGWNAVSAVLSFNNIDVTAKNRGIYIEVSGKATFNDVNATSSNSYAIHLGSGASGAHEFDTLTLNAKEYGLYVYRGGTRFVNLDITSSHGDALFMFSDYDATLDRLTIDAPSGYGINLGWANYNRDFTISNSTINAREQGIRIEKSDVATLNNLIVSSSNSDAIYLGSGASGAHALSNLTLEAGESGVRMDSQLYSASIDNICVNASKYGVWVSNWNTRAVSITDSKLTASDYGIRTDADSASGRRTTASGNCILKSSAPRAYSNSTSHNFNGNYWQGVAGGVSYSDGNVRDSATLASCPVLSCYGEPSVVTAPVAEWRMDESAWSGSAGEVRDSIGDAHASAIGASTNVAGKLCRAGDLSASGTADYLRLPESALHGRTDFSFALWYKSSVNKGQQELLQALGAGADDDEIELYLVNKRKIRLKFLDTEREFNIGFDLDDGQWHHIAITRAGASGCLYVDGALNACQSFPTGALSIAANSLLVGQEQDSIGGGFSNSQSLEALVDEYKAFNGALTAGQIAVGYANEVAGRNWDGTARVCASTGPAALNAVDTGAHPVTGSITTKSAGSGFNLDIRALNAGRDAADASANGDVLADLLANTAAGVTLDANNCPTSGTSLAVGTATLTAGAASIAVPAVAEAWRDVRVRMRYPAAGPYTVTACSADNFAIKPATLTAIASDADWASAGTTRTLANTGATGGVVHKAGQPFTLRVTGYNAASVITSQYDGAAAAAATCVLPASGCVAGSLSPGSFSASGGTLISNTATFSEVGAVSVSFTDTTFAAVDNDDTAASCAGFHVCSSAINVGRFVPDHYDVASIQSPVFRTFGSACASRSFTYVGQEFGFATLPRARVTAKNAAGGTTANAKGTLWKLSPNGHFGSSWRCQKTGGDSCGSVSLTSAGFSAENLVANSDGTGDFTWPTNLFAPNGVKYSFTRSNPPMAPFSAEIGLGVTIRDNSEAGNCGLASCLILDSQPANPPTWGGNIAFDAGNAFRQGRLRLSNAAGSELLPLPAPLVAQYWNGQGWATNTADQCTAISSPTLTFFAQSADNQLASGETTASFNAALVAGDGNPRFSAPGAGNHGFLDVTVAAPAWLKSNRDGVDQGGDGDLLDDDPRARVSFGKRAGSGKVIYRREMY